ncbi:MAG: PadR family transcriptional regulator [Firmicutes bacterium]|nr:PadR family transcriptional regulator [Bacillota bacterium]
MDIKELGFYYEPSLLILISLADGEKHGYAMMEDIRSSFEINMGPGTLYGALARLEKAGMIEPLPAEDRRRPYRLTPDGWRVLRRQLQSASKVIQIGQQRAVLT